MKRYVSSRFLITIIISLLNLRFGICFTFQWSTTSLSADVTRTRPTKIRHHVSRSILPPEYYLFVNKKRLSIICHSGPQYNNGQNEQQQQQSNKIPFLIERLPERPNNQLFQDISNMCITAFFNDINNNQNQNQQQNTGLLKRFQLSVLRRMQIEDLKIRRKRKKDTNIMFVAYKIIPVAANTNLVQQTPLLLNLDGVQNVNTLLDNDDKLSSSIFQQNENFQWNTLLSNGKSNIMSGDYVRGEVIGFVEVTQRQYGLGDTLFYENETNNNNINDDKKESNGIGPSTFFTQLRPKTKQQMNNNNNTKKKKINGTTNTIIRPVLTNLSVKRYARKSGVGTLLLDACENFIQNEWNMNEIILEVEDDNKQALEFYKKRQYKILYEDPTGRRYDVNGLLLKQVRCKRYILRKDLISINNNIVTRSTTNFKNGVVEEVQATFNRGIKTIKRFMN